MKRSRLIACVFFSIIILPTFSSFFPSLELYLIPLRMNYFVVLFTWFLLGTFVYEFNDRLIKNQTKSINSEKLLNKVSLKFFMKTHVLHVSFLIISLIIFGSSILDISDMNSYFYEIFR